MSTPDDRSGLDPLDDAVPVSDAEALSRLRRWGGDKLVDQMVGLFLAQAPDRIAAARKGFAAGSPEDVERATHSLRSSSAQIGAMRVQVLCAAIEPSAAKGDLTGLGDLLASLELELNRYRVMIESGGPPCDGS